MRFSDYLEYCKTTEYTNKCIFNHEKFGILYEFGLNCGINIYNELFDNIINLDLSKSQSPINILIKRISDLSKLCRQFGYQDIAKKDDNGDVIIDPNTKSVIMIPDEDGFKGAMMEIFIEAFSKLLSDLPYYNYMPNDSEDDNGVDGFAISKSDNRIATIQIKYRMFNVNKRIYLTEKHIRQFPLQSFIKYKVELNSANHCFLISSCDGAHYYTKENVYLNSFDDSINIDYLRNKVDRNLGFWNNIKDMIKNSVFLECGETCIINPIFN